MDNGEKVEEDIELVAEPEESVRSLPNWRPGEDEDGDHETVETDPGHSCHRLEEPEADIRRHPGREEYLLGHALEVVGWLGAQVVEVDHVGNGVHNGEEEVIDL